MNSVLFVCMANICRSPALEATLRHLAAKRGVADSLLIDSCGVGWAHLGQYSDPRTFEAAKAKGILIDHRSQQFQDSFFEEFDLILTVDADIAEQLKARSAPAIHPKIHLASAFSKKFKGQEIPDPYYMGPDGFNVVMEMILDCCEGILNYIIRLP